MSTRTIETSERTFALRPCWNSTSNLLLSPNLKATRKAEGKINFSLCSKMKSNKVEERKAVYKRQKVRWTFESGLINRIQNSHCHMSYSSYNHWFRRHPNVLVRNTRTSFIFLKIFVKNSVKVRHSQQRFRKKNITAREGKIGSEGIFTTFRKGHWEWMKRRAW